MNRRMALLVVAMLAAAAPVPGAARRLREADRLWRSGSLAKAQRMLEELDRETAAAGDARVRVAVLRDLGRALDMRGESDAAAKSWRQARELASSQRDRALLATIAIEEGFAAWRQADYALAERLAHNAEDGGDRAKTALLLGRIEVKRGRYDDGTRLEHEALAIEVERGDPQAQADVHQALGEALLDLRSFAAAVATLERRLALVRSIGDPRQEAHALSYIGIVQQMGGDLDASLASHSEALRIARRSRDEGAISHALHAMGSVHRDLGRLELAKSDYTEAIRLRAEAGDPRSRAWSLAALGRIEKELQQPRAALDAYDGAVAIFEALRDRRALAWHLFEIARLRVLLDERRAARDAFELSLALMDAVDLPYASMALGEYGRLLAQEGDAGRAVALGRSARERAEATGNPEMRWTAAQDNGRILLDLRRPEPALRSFLDGLTIIEEMTTELLPSDAAKSGFFEKRQSLFEDTASLLVDLGRPEQALEIAERARARAFLDLLGSDRPASVPPAREPERVAPVSPADDDTGPPPADDVQRGGPGSPASSGERTASALTSLATVDPPRLADIRDEARRRASPIIEYFTTQGRLLAWLVTADGEVHVAALAVDRAQLLREAEAARTESEGQNARRALHRRLIAPFERFLPSDPGRAVLVVPHGPLFLVSLAGLPDETGRYVAERHAIAYAPSVGVLRAIGARAPHPASTRRGVLVVGNPSMPARRSGDPPLPPLPAADDEAESVRRAWPDDATIVLRGAAAAEAAVRRLAPDRALIHIATHGVVRPDDPMQSFLALSPGGAPGASGDGFLTAREVFDLRLSADLVVLSACDTGRGRIDSDGVMGFGRAFLQAGSRAVVVTLWRVADRVALHEMKAFHGELRRGTPRAEALRRAQTDTLAALRAGSIRTASGAPLAESPALWAAFAVVGDPGGP